MPLPVKVVKGSETLNLEFGDRKLSLFRGDIFSLNVDAIVCPVDQNLDLRNGFARTLSRAAGKEFRIQRPIVPEPYGKVVVLPGGDMKARYIFLTVLLGERGIEKVKTSINQAVERAILYAEFMKLKSIAFPLMGSAKAAPPFTLIAREMLINVNQYFHRRKTKLNAIFVSLFNPEAFDSFCKEAEEIAGL